MARGSFRFLVSGEMKKYPRNEQLKPMQLSVQTESSDNKSPLSLGRICNWFLPRRNYPFSSSLMRILDYEILLLNWLRNEKRERVRFSKKMDRSSSDRFPIPIPVFPFFYFLHSQFHASTCHVHHFDRNSLSQFTRTFDSFFLFFFLALPWLLLFLEE